MNKPSAFDVLNEMSRRNMKSLKGFGLSNIISVRAGKQRGSITIMVDNETATKIMLQEPIKFMLIVADADDYKKVENELVD